MRLVLFALLSVLAQPPGLYRPAGITAGDLPRLSTAQFAQALLPPADAARVASHTVGTFSTAGRYGLTLRTAPWAPAPGLCRIDAYTATLATTPGQAGPEAPLFVQLITGRNGFSQQLWIAVAPDCAALAPAAYAQITPSVREPATVEALAWLTSLKATAAGGRSGEVPVRCESRDYPALCGDDPVALVAAMPMERLVYVGSGGSINLKDFLFDMTGTGGAYPPAPVKFRWRVRTLRPPGQPPSISLSGEVF